MAHPPEASERRRGPDRRRRVRRQADDLVHYFEQTCSAGAVTIRDVACVLGISEGKVRREIAAGALHAFRLPAGRRCVWRIRFAEAQAYLYRVGALARVPGAHAERTGDGRPSTRRRDP